MLEGIRRYAAAPAFEDPGQNRIARLMNAILISAFIALIIVTVVLTLTDVIMTGMLSRDAIIVLGVGILLALTTLGLRFLMHRGRLQLAGSILSSALLLATAFTIYSYYGIRHVTTTAFLLVITLAGVLVGGRAAFIFTGLSLVTIVGAFVAEITGTMVLPPNPLPGPFELITLITTISLMGLLIRFVVQSINQGFEQARRNELAQIEINRALQASTASLELRTRQLERRAVQLQAAAEIAKSAVAIRDVPQLLQEAVQLISQRFGFYHAGVFLIDEAGEYAVLRAASSEGGQRMLGRGHKLAVGKIGIVGYVTGSGKPRIALDVGVDAVHFANPDLPETRSEMALPLMWGEEVIGAIDVQSVEENAFTNEDILVLQTMADQLAVAIENARLIEQQMQLANERRRVIELYQELAQILRYDELLLRASRAIQQRLGFRGVCLGMVEAQEIVVRSASSDAGSILPLVGDSTPLGQGWLGRAAIQRKLQVFSSDDHVRWLGYEITPEIPFVIYAVPLLHRGEVTGVLAIEAQIEEGIEVVGSEITEFLANLISVLLDNTRLVEETQESLQQLDALYRQQTMDGWTKLISDRISRGELASLEYPRTDPGLDQSLMGTELATDIQLRGETIGSLIIQSSQSSDWSEDDRSILEAIAGEVASALETARLLEEIQRRALQLQTAAEIARDTTGLIDLPTLLERGVNLIQNRFGFYHVSIYLMDEEGKAAYIREATGEPGRQMKAQHHSLLVGSKSIIGYVTLTGECYVANDVAEDPHFRSNPLLPETQSELGAPMKIGDRVIGALDIQHSMTNIFSEDDIIVFETLADQIAVAIQNARLFEETYRRAEREQTIIEITSRLRTSSDVDGLLRTALQEMRKALGAKRAHIQLSSVPMTPTGDGHGKDGDGHGTSNRMS